MKASQQLKKKEEEVDMSGNVGKSKEEKEMELFEAAYQAAEMAAKENIELLNDIPVELRPTENSGFTEENLRRSFVRSFVEMFRYQQSIKQHEKGKEGGGRGR